MTTEAPLSQDELRTALVALIVMLGEASTGNIPLEAQLDLRRRLVGIGAVPLGTPLEQVWQVMGDLIQHLHRLDRPEPFPKGQDLPVENLVAFTDEATARRYATDMRALGKDLDDPLYEPNFKRWTVVIRSERAGEQGSPTAGKEAYAAHLLGGWHLGARG
ncbi:hypothetical protein FHN55_20105 [Streptomyces sp. NP160]|uniref:hypothetical protein n=1 Tax=Streptomyces sp. NP160 TaxID=2586637 RepID=UPI001118A86C|nr:hypothetical protein [Streptomyces sp. NP160]TNM59803.1 hypothetical protein FHN55_20105 [Streptomyces sp. NP160]